MSDEARRDDAVAPDDLTRLAGSIAHDLNNLLTSIRGLTALVLEELPQEGALRRDLEEIQKAAVRATALTGRLKDMARGTVPEGTHVEPHQAAGSPPAAAGAEVILVADDEDSVRKLVVRVLERAGYHVLQAKDAAQALTLAEGAEGRIDLLLTDVVMPRAGGQQLYRLINDRWPGVRVLYMSGYTDDPVVRREAEEPGGAFLGKPFAPDDLLATVRRVLDRDSQTLADR